MTKSIASVVQTAPRRRAIPNLPYNNLGTELRHYRKSHDMSAKVLAPKIGLAVSALYNIEKGLRAVSLAECEALEAFYGVKFKYRKEAVKKIIRGRPAVANPRNHNLAIPLTLVEFEQVKAVADLFGVRPSVFARDLLLTVVFSLLDGMVAYKASNPIKHESITNNAPGLYESRKADCIRFVFEVLSNNGVISDDITDRLLECEKRAQMLKALSQLQECSAEMHNRFIEAVKASSPEMYADIVKWQTEVKK
jgi:transcriptional regulator with XRE-family HTH domain